MLLAVEFVELLKLVVIFFYPWLISNLLIESLWKRITGSVSESVLSEIEYTFYLIFFLRWQLVWLLYKYCILLSI
jgi:hypothetical protein